jgi:hypothetical protein
LTLFITGGRAPIAVDKEAGNQDPTTGRHHSSANRSHALNPAEAFFGRPDREESFHARWRGKIPASIPETPQATVQNDEYRTC